MNMNKKGGAGSLLLLPFRDVDKNVTQHIVIQVADDIKDFNNSEINLNLMIE